MEKSQRRRGGEKEEERKRRRERRRERGGEKEEEREEEEREETNSMLIVATIFCLQLPRATHALSSDKLDDLLVYVAREAITKGVSRKRGKEKTDMFSLGFICE